MEFETSLMATNTSPLALTSNSSPLEVLSNAAALIEKSKTCDEFQTRFLNTIKELPTKENKMKRTKDRRELAHSSSFKIKARSSSPPNDESMVCDRAEHSLSPNFSPSTPTSLQTTAYTLSADLSESANNTANNALSLSSYSTYTGFSQRSATDRTGLLSSYRGSPYHPIDGTNNTLIIRRNSDPNSQHSSTHSLSDSNGEYDDKPLDMSNKKYRNPDCSESQSSPESKSDSYHMSRSPPNYESLFGQQMMRPSVITCGSSLMKSQQQISQPSVVAQSPSPTSNCQNCCTNDESTTQSGDNSDNSYISVSNGGEEYDNHCKRHRKRDVIVTNEGVSDPVIEEHFRRSLGKDYSQIFSNSTNNNSITYSVDDHFAKALGDTWIRLQKTSTRIDESSNKNNAQSIAS